MGLVIFLVIDGVVIAISAVGVYVALRQKWEVVSTFIAAGTGAVVGSIIVIAALPIVSGVSISNILADWNNWFLYIAFLGGILGLVTGLTCIGISAAGLENGWDGTVTFVITVILGAVLNNVYVFGSALIGGTLSRLFGG